MGGQMNKEVTEFIQVLVKAIVRIVVGLTYFVGVSITGLLSILFLSRSEIILNPEAMIPTTISEWAFEVLGIGFLPMFIATIAFYNVYGIANSTYSRIKGILVFIPSLFGIAIVLLHFSNQSYQGYRLNRQ